MDQDPSQEQNAMQGRKKKMPTSMGITVGLNRLNIPEANPMFLYKGAWFCFLREHSGTHAVTSASSLWIPP